jgi:predicted 2-oxoglutarate/Fe(II)-dependent dioxygenase YbiX
LVDYGDAYIPSFDPPISINRHFPLSFCKLLVEELDRSSSVDSGVFSTDGSAKVDSYHRSSTAVMPSNEMRSDAELIMTTATDLFSTSVLAKRAHLAEPIQFLKYESDRRGHFLAHTDNAYYDSHGVFRYTSPQRVLSCLAYLNDDYEGGELIFNTVRDVEGYPIRLKPKVGELIIFPSDIRFMHEVLPVTKGRRYSMVGWYGLK